MKFISLLLINAGLAIPMTFFAVALPALMREAEISLTLIGLTALVYLPYALAFFWAPIVDSRPIGPFNGLGRRRSWIVTVQLVMAAITALAALASPSKGFVVVLLAGVLISLLGATQRTALLGFAVESLRERERPWGTALLMGGGAFGALIGASGLLLVHAELGWSGSMLAMAGLLIGFLLPVLALKEGHNDQAGDRARSPSLRRFFRRPEVRPVLFFMLPLGVGIGLGFGMMQPRLVDLGFTLDQIGLINGIFTCAALFTGGPLSAFFVSRFGLRPVLPVGIVLSATVLIYVAIASYLELSAYHTAAAVVLFYLTFSFVSVVTNTIFMTQSEAGQAGTDFTLFICFYWLFSMIGIGLSGLVADQAGYAATFASGAVLVLASLALARSLPRDSAVAPVPVS